MKKPFAKSIRTLVLASASVITFGFASQALAQVRAGVTDPSADNSKDEANGDIVVTARRTEERLLDTPVAVTAFGAKELKSRQIEDLSDVALLTPGLSFESYLGGANATPVIRGATQQSITVLEQNVSVFLDGIYLPRGYVLNLGTDGLERVEVVKGPQGALYGQNAFMGAVNYVTKAPTDKFAGEVSATAGTDKRFDLNGSLNLPIIPGILAARFNGGYSTFDGTWKNNHPLAAAEIAGPHTKNNFGGWDKWNAGARILFTPSDSIKIDASYRHFNIENEGSPKLNFQGADSQSSPASVISTRNNCAKIDPTFGFGLYCGGIPSLNPDTFAQDPRQTGTFSNSDFVSVKAEFNASDALNLSYTFGLIDSEAVQITSQNDFRLLTPGGTLVYQAVPVGGFNYRQHELRAQYKFNENFDLQVGGFYSTNDDRYKFLLGVGIPALSTTPVLLSQLTIVSENSRTMTDTKALFGSFHFGFMDGRANLSLEGRYTWEDKSVLSIQSNVLRQLKSNFFNPRIIVDYKLSSDSLIYASAASGTKAGGANAEPALYTPFGGLLASERTYGADKNWTYEIGTKNKFFGGKLQLEFAAFLIKWSNMQINSLSTPPPGVVFPPSVLRAPTIVLNLGDATIKGIEFQGQIRPTENLTLLFGGSYQDAKYDQGVLGTRTLNICDDIVCGQFIGGNQLQRSPSTQLFGGFNFEHPIGNGSWRVMLQGDVAWQNRQFTDETNTAFIKPRTLANFSAGVGNDWLDLRLWVKNAFNQNYVSAAIFGPFRSSFYSPIAGPRRTAGITLSGKF